MRDRKNQLLYFILAFTLGGSLSKSHKLYESFTWIDGITVVLVIGVTFVHYYSKSKNLQH